VSRVEGMQEWWTTAEIAAAGLPDMPATKRGVNMLADAQGWRDRAGLARRRKGKGGGWEYSRRAFPAAAQARIAAQARAPAAPPPQDAEADWARWHAATDAARAKAQRRLDALAQVEMLVDGGLTKQAAVRDTANAMGVAARSLWNWCAAVEFLPRADWAPALLERRDAGPKPAQRGAVDGDFWDAFRAAYMRQAQPSFADCFRKTAAVAAREGWSVPAERTFHRRFFEATDKLSLTLAREGLQAASRLYPAQRRSRAHLHALEWVNADGHKFDVMVAWPDGTKARPQMVCYQDVYSGKLLSWRVDQTLHSMGALLAFRDVLQDFGVPDHCLFDNGREFASKLLTGGAPTRFRFKVRADELPGVLTMLDVKVHWATPYSGQSKPIERAFRDLCDSVSKHPAFDRAYVGNKPGARPEDFARAVPLALFEEVLAEGIAEHNARRGRRSETAAGRSFDEAFAASFAAAPIRQATEAQQRLCLMAADGVRAQAPNGEIRLHGNVYWSPWLAAHAGARLTARFDPADLQRGLHLYAADGRHLGEVACFEKVGFDSLDGAREHNRARRAYMRALKDAEAAQRKMTAAEVAALMRADAAEDAEEIAAPPRPRIVRGAFGAPATAAAVYAAPEETPHLPSDLTAEEARAAWQRGVMRLVPQRDED